MAVLIFSEGKWQPIAGNKIYDGSKWVGMSADSKLFLNNEWYNFGWETSKPIGQDVVMPNYPGFDFSVTELDTDADWSHVTYATPTGAGKMDGSSWDNACAGIYAAIQYNKSTSPVVFCSGGIYDEPLLYTGIFNATVYGGFGPDRSMVNRDTLKYPTIINSVFSTDSSKPVNCLNGFDGCIGTLCATYIYGCLCTSSNYINTVSNSVIVGYAQEIDYYSIHQCSNSTFINCSMTIYAHKEYEWNINTSAFLNCTLKNTNNSLATFYRSHNILAINCWFDYGAAADGGCYFLTIVNCEHIKYKDDKYSGISIGSSSTNSLMFSSRHNTAYINGYTIALGNDNTISKFKSTGYFPTRGVVDIGECPSPIKDMQGFVNYVNSFGDWRPTKGSVLSYRGYDDGATPKVDILGSDRPSPPTLGAYETLETE